MVAGSFKQASLGRISGALDCSGQGAAAFGMLTGLSLIFLESGNSSHLVAGFISPNRYFWSSYHERA